MTKWTELNIAITEALWDALYQRAKSERVTIEQIVVPILELAVNSKPVETDPEWARSLAAGKRNKYRPGCPECGSLSGHQKGCKGGKL